MFTTSLSTQLRGFRFAVLVCLTASMATGSAVADIAVLKEGAAQWNIPANWTIDGEMATEIPGGPARSFWGIVIDESDAEANLFLEAGLRQIHSLTINGGDTLQIKEGANLIMLTDALQQGGNVISNSGTIFIVEDGRLVVNGNTTPDPDDGVVTISGGGAIVLDAAPRSPANLGAYIGGQGPEPHVLVNEDNTISGAGRIGLNSLRIINRGEIVANEPDKTLSIDPRTENFPMFAGFTNDGGTVRATGGGILRLAAGTFVNINKGKFIAEGISEIEIIFAHITGGTLMSTPAGAFRVLNDSSLTGEAQNKLTIAGNVDVQDDAELTLRGGITNTGDIAVNAGDRITSVLIDGDVTVDGGGRIRINSSIPNLALGGVVPAAPGAKLTIGEDQEVSGVGTVGSGELVIDNQGTIAASQKGRTLVVNPSAGTDVTSSGLFEARNGGTLVLQRGWNLSGDGKIRSRFSEIFDDGPSVVLLDGVNISGQRLQTPDNPTASALTAIDEIDPGKGVIRTRNLSTTFDLRDNPPINEGLLEIADASRLTLQSKAAADGATAPALENGATILLNALPGGVAELWVSGGDVRLTGGGQIVLSDADRNRIDQSVTEGITHTLINVDNLIVGAGNIGNRRLNLVNESAGTIIADGSNPLVIETPFDVDAINRGVISTNAEATLILRNSKFTNEAGARLQSRHSGTLRIEGGALTNNGTVAAEGLDGMAARSVIENAVVLNRGVIEATDGSKIEIRSSGIANLVGVQPGMTGPVLGTIAARDASVVEISGTTIVTGGLLQSSNEGRIRVVDRNVSFVLPVINAATLEIADGARATIVGEEVEFGGNVTVRSDLLNLTNTATITLNANQGTSQIRVFGDFNRLSGGGEIVLSDDTGNSITPVLGRSVLLNEDNTIRGAGEITVALRNRDDGTIIADGVNPLKVLALSDETLFPDSNAPELREFSGLFNRGLIRAEGTGGIQLVHENAASDGLIPAINAGRMEVAAGSRLDIVDQGPAPPFLNVGRIVIEGAGVGVSTPGGRMTVTTLRNRRPNSDMQPRPPDSVQSNGGIIVIDGRFDGTLLNGGIVTGTGSLNGSLVGAGKFRPGKSPGTFDITGRYEQLPGGELEIELAGMNVGEQYDQVVVDGEALLGGTVVVTHLDGFLPEVGSDFDVVSATSFVDTGFSMAMLDGGLVQPAMVDIGDGTTALRLTSIEGVRYAPETGSWDEAENWTGDSLPSMDDSAWIVGDPAADTTVTGPATDTSVYSLVIGSGDEATPSNTTLDLDAGIITTTRGTTLRRDALLTGNGTLGGDVYNAGTVATNSLQVLGNYSQNATGTFAIEVGGTTPGVDFDQLTIQGTAAIDGNLDVTLVDRGNGPFQPAGGEVFTILSTQGEIIGVFDSVNLPTLGDDVVWHFDYLPDAVALRTSLAGDYNDSGSVEQGDLDLVLLTWGDDVAVIPPPDVWINQRPQDGLIGQAHLDSVLLNWGNAIGSAAVATAIPEPTTRISLLVAVAVGIALASGHARGWNCRWTFLIRS